MSQENPPPPRKPARSRVPVAASKTRGPNPPETAQLQATIEVATQVVPHGGDVIPNPSWAAVPPPVSAVPDDVPSAFTVTIQQQVMPLPVNGRAVPFGSDPVLRHQGGLVLTFPGVDRIHGFVRFNPVGGPLLADGSRAGSLELYDGNGQGRPSTNHIFRQTPGQPIGYPIPAGIFHTIQAEDVITVVGHTMVLGQLP